MGKKKTSVFRELFPHFRYYKKSGHPALIVGEMKVNEKDHYKYRKVMHGERDGRHLNEKVIPNPKPGDPKPMYIAKRVRNDEKKYFGNKLPWKYHKK
ncbi:MAG: hypothetical protein IKB34_05575 [Clostridia bacterium]|nr:hypothetical protein [Clostridia bacterium]